MKIRIIIILLLLGLFAAFQFYLGVFQANVISPSYEVVRVENEFEIRSYTQPTGSEESGSKLVAVLKFGGYASPRLTKFYGDKLKTALSQNEIISSNDFLCLQYNSQYQIVGRKNEIVVEVRNAKIPVQ